MAEQMQCGFHFGPGVRCLMVDGHDEPYYPYLDYGQTGEYSDLLRRGTPHQVVADAPEVPPREQWTGKERRDSLPRWPQFKVSAHPSEPEHAHEWHAVSGYMGNGRLCIGCGVTQPSELEPDGD